MQKKAAEGKKTATSRLSSKANSKNASAAASDNEEQLDAHGNPIQSDEPATGDDKMEAVKKLAAQVDKFGVSCYPSTRLGDFTADTDCSSASV